MKNINIPVEIIEALEPLPAEIYGEILRIINNYVISGTLPADNASPTAKAIFIISKKLIDKANRRIIADRTQAAQSPAPIEPAKPVEPQPVAELTPSPQPTANVDNFEKYYSRLTNGKSDSNKALHDIYDEIAVMHIPCTDLLEDIRGAHDSGFLKDIDHLEYHQWLYRLPSLVIDYLKLA